jgi:hypothetical protein
VTRELKRSVIDGGRRKLLLDRSKDGNLLMMEVVICQERYQRRIGGGR